MGIVKRLVLYYRNDMTLSSKLLISHLTLILVLTLTIISFFTSSVYNLLINTTINSKQQTALSTASSVETQLDMLVNNTESVATAYYRFIANQYLLEEYGDDQYNAEYFLKAIKAAAYPELNVVYQIYVQPDKTELLENKTLAPYVQSMEAIYGTYWYGILSEDTEPQTLFCPSLYLSPQETQRYGDLAYVYALPESISRDTDGYLVAYFSQEAIISALEKNLSVSRGASYIINSRDALVCDSDAALVGAYYINNDEVDRIVAEGGNASYLGSDIIVGSYPVNRTDWKVVSILPRADALKEAGRSVAQFFSIYGLVALFSALLSIFLARSISGRISSVVQQMGQIHGSRPEKITSLPPARDEVGQMVVSYNSMTDSLNALMDRETEIAKTLRLSEFKALQAQINPHFLYNSLDMINWLAVAGQQDQVCEAVQSLGRFYKLTLSKKDTFGTVRKETDHATLYVKLQNMRYENRIRFVVDIDENMHDCVMPKLVFQPLVENAILHGIMERPDRTGEVLLAGWRDQNDLLFLIFDNGVGMTQEQIDELMHPNTGDSKTGKTGSNIGVYNTHERLQLYYGPQYGLEYKSTPGKGTEVYIRIPVSPENP